MKPEGDFFENYSAWVKHFQESFVVYFPRLDDESVASMEMDWLHSRVFGNSKETIRRRPAKAELKKVEKALRTLAQVEMPYGQFISFNLAKAELRENDTDRVLAWERKIYDFIYQLSEPWCDEIFDLAGVHQDDGAVEDALNERRRDVSRAIDKFVADAERGIDSLPETANVNWPAVHSVDALRTLWWRNTNKEGPARALNPASPFYQYLCDGFAFLDIGGDPVSAFKRWAARASK